MFLYISSSAIGVKNQFLSTEPFNSNSSKIEIHIYANTSDLGCYNGCFDIDRLMCCDDFRVISAAAASGYYYDEIIVIHNTSTYAGGGSRDLGYYRTNSYDSYCQVYDGESSGVMAIHEFGHSFGNLCDEYLYSGEGLEYNDCANCKASCVGVDWFDQCMQPRL